MISKQIKNQRNITRCTVQPSNLGSSETTREAPLDNFDLYFNNFQPTHIKTKDSQFRQWFIGFSKGDGSFIIVKNRCYFIINQKHIKLLYKIRKNLGFGKVICYNQTNQTYGRYLVHDQNNCKRLASIFNGKLVLNKTNKKFQCWAKVLNVQLLKTKGQCDLNNA